MNSKGKGEPVKLYQKRSDVVPLALFEYKTGCTVMNALKAEKLI